MLNLPRSRRRAVFAVVVGLSLILLTSQTIFVVVLGIDYEPFPYAPRAGEVVTFDVTRSEKWYNETFDTKTISYSWDFGDGTMAQGGVVSHAFANAGLYAIKLNVTDTLGLSIQERQLTVTERTPFMAYVSVSNTYTFTGEEVTINGNLTQDINGKGVANAFILLSWSTAWWTTWHEITSVKTDALGEFSMSWMPPANNKYQIKATWVGNSTYPETSSSALLVITPLGGLITGFSSNST
jgi:hypothetical protein